MFDDWRLGENVLPQQVPHLFGFGSYITPQKMTSTLQRNIDLALGTKSQPLRWKMSSWPRLFFLGSPRPSGDVKIAIEAIVIEIMSFPIKHGDFE